MNPLMKEYKALMGIISPLPFRHTLDISADELAGIKAVALKHNLLMLVYSRLRKYSTEFVPNEAIAEFLKSLEPLYLKNAVNSMRQEAFENKTISILMGINIPAIVIKGNSLAKEIYGDPNCRSSCDIDLLIKSEDALRADSILLQSGYARGDTNPLNFWLGRLHHAVYWHKRAAMMLELHWNLGIPLLFDLSSEDIWKEVNYHEGVPGQLSPEMTLIHLLTHHFFGHSFREPRILVDILWALSKYSDSIDWQAFAVKLRKIGLVKSTQISLGQIMDLWGDIDKDIPSVAALRQSVEKIGGRPPEILTSYFKMDLEAGALDRQNMDKIATRLALDRHGTILYSFVKTVLPPPQAVKDFFGDMRNWTLPFNYMRFIIWRMLRFPRG